MKPDVGVVQVGVRRTASNSDSASVAQVGMKAASNSDSARTPSRSPPPEPEPNYWVPILIVLVFVAAAVAIWYFFFREEKKVVKKSDDKTGSNDSSGDSSTTTTQGGTVGTSTNPARNTSPNNTNDPFNQLIHFTIHRIHLLTPTNPPSINTTAPDPVAPNAWIGHQYDKVPYKLKSVVNPSPNDGKFAILGPNDVYDPTKTYDTVEPGWRNLEYWDPIVAPEPKVALYRAMPIAQLFPMQITTGMLAQSETDVSVKLKIPFDKITLPSQTTPFYARTGQSVSQRVILFIDQTYFPASLWKHLHDAYVGDRLSFKPSSLFSPTFGTGEAGVAVSQCWIGGVEWSSDEDGSPSITLTREDEKGQKVSYTALNNGIVGLNIVLDPFKHLLDFQLDIQFVIKDFKKPPTDGGSEVL